MRIRRIEIEGARGKATLSRDGADIVIVVEGHEHPCMDGTWRAGASDLARQGVVARTLQRALDGYDGTAGDVADYARLLEILAD